MKTSVQGIHREPGPVSLPSLPSRVRGSVATVGTFDGMHVGHWKVLREIGRQARQQGRPSVLVTFWPHPLSVLRAASSPLLLNTLAEKKEILTQTGVDYTAFVPFTHALSRYSPRRFVEEVLVARMRVRELVVGYDHGFGRGRSGDATTLASIGVELGFGVEVVAPVFRGEAPVSSSRIRNTLLAGDAEEAAALLGRPYSFSGRVVRGAGRGRRLGFPTANIEVDDAVKLIPGEGIYAVRAEVDGTTRAGALHIGPRPTFPGAAATIEVHLLDWSGDIYGGRLRIELINRLRGIRPFATPEALARQMSEDVHRVRALLGAAHRTTEPESG